ncbi:hypothetical protein EON62_05485 [archaeon]|nr:MAG: hypothetical protein EON62_05485 [archaeon]
MLARRPGSPGAVAWSPPRPAAPQADVAALLNSSAQARRRVRPAQPSPAELSTVFTHFRIKSGSTAGVPDAAVMDEHAAAGSATVETEAPSLTNNPASGAPLTAPQPAAAFLAAQCHAPYALGFSKLLSSLSVALPAESAAFVSSADTAAYATAKLRPMARTDSTFSLSSSGTLGLRGRPQTAGAVARGVAAQNHAAREGERRADAARSGGASPSIRLVLPHPSSLPRQGSASQLRSTDALVGVATGQRLSHGAHRVVDVTAAGTAALAHVPTRPSPTATMTNGDSGHGQDERAVLLAPNEGSAPHRSAERKDEFNDSKEDILEDEGDEGDDSTFQATWDSWCKDKVQPIN